MAYSNDFAATDDPGTLPDDERFEPTEDEIYQVRPKENVNDILPLGNNGIFAQVGPFGSLIQISKYFREIGKISAIELTRTVGTDEDGFFDADTRQGLFEDLMNDDIHAGIGLYLHDEWSQPMPSEKSVTWLFNRWPEIRWKTTQGLSIRVRLVVQDASIVQDYRVENHTAEVHKITFGLNLRLSERWHGDLHMRHDQGYESSQFRHDRKDRHTFYSRSKNLEFQTSVFSPRPIVDSASEQLNSREPSYSDQSQGHEVEDTIYSTVLRPGTVHETVAVYRIQEVSGAQTPQISTQREVQTLHAQASECPSADAILLQERLIQNDQAMSTDLHSSKNQNSETVSPVQATAIGDDQTACDQSTLLLRNLEHMLSVCAVTTNAQTAKEDFSDQNRGDHLEETTSDDAVCFHNAYIVDASASSLSSFFAFRYLLMMYRWIRNRQEPRLGRNYLQRIEAVCFGHLLWTFESCTTIETVGEEGVEGAWRAVYYPNGTTTKENPKPSFVAGSLNHLKLRELSIIFPKKAALLSNRFAPKTLSWLKFLKRSRHKNKLWFDCSVFLDIELDEQSYHSSLVLPKYKLTHLTTLWLALKSIKEHLYETIVKTNAAMADDIQRHINELRFPSLRKEILRAFTVDRKQIFHSMHSQEEEEPTSNVGKARQTSHLYTSKRQYLHEISKDFIAQFQLGKLIEDGEDSRSDSERGNNKSLHSGSNILLANRTANPDEIRFAFYTYDILVLDAAKHGFFNSEDRDSLSAWEEAVNQQSQRRFEPKIAQFALGLLLSRYREATESQPPSQDLRNRTKELRQLLREHYSNSGIMGARFWRDEGRLYWRLENRRTPFLVPTVLLEDEDQRLGLNWTMPQNSDPDIHEDSANDIKASMNTSSLQVLKKLPLRSTKINKENVHDGEKFSYDWLYKYPRFFVERPLELSGNEIQRWTNDTGIRILGEAFDECDWIGSSEFKGVKKNAQFQFTKAILVADIPMKEKREEAAKIRTAQYKEPKALHDKLRGARTINRAKKRIIFLPHCDRIGALIVSATSGRTFEERRPVASFFYNHSNGWNYHREWLHEIGNVWDTDFNLSFYQIVSVATADKAQQALLSWDRRLFPGSRKGNEKFIVRAGVGYRFTGDLYDRYWTCYIAASLVDSFKDEWFDDSYDDDWLSQKKRMNQRRLLELFLAEKITSMAWKSGSEILKAIEDTSRRDGTLEEESLHNDHQERHPRWLNFLRTREILHDLDNSYEEILRGIEQWKYRERDRPVQPRWTEKDEKRYRSKIEEQQRRVRRNINRLEDQKARIESLSTFVDSQSNLLMSQLQLEESLTNTSLSQDVRLYTTVTIVFLPLSFSTSLFSMAGIPDSGTTRSMIITAIVALAITLFVLANVRVLDRHARSTYLRFKWLSTSLMKRSELPSGFVDWKDVAREFERYREHGVQPNRSPGFWWILIFQFVLLFDIPARFVGKAIAKALSGREDRRWYSLQLALYLVIGFLAVPLWMIIYLFQIFWVCIPVQIGRTGIHRRGSDKDSQEEKKLQRAPVLAKPWIGDYKQRQEYILESLRKPEVAWERCRPWTILEPKEDLPKMQMPARSSSATLLNPDSSQPKSNSTNGMPTPRIKRPFVKPHPRSKSLAPKSMSPPPRCSDAIKDMEEGKEPQNRTKQWPTWIDTQSTVNSLWTRASDWLDRPS